MCIVNGVEFTSDVGRIINKFDIYLCNLGEVTEGGDLGKTRPCVIIQSDRFNNVKQNTYIVAPIRTSHDIIATKNNLQEIVDIKRRLGTLYIPIETEKDTFRFIDMTKLRYVQSKNVLRYKNTIINPLLKKQINDCIMQIFFSDEEMEEIIFKEDFKTDLLHTTTDEIQKEEPTPKKKEKGDKEVIPLNVKTVLQNVRSGAMPYKNATKKLGITFPEFVVLMDGYENNIHHKNGKNITPLPMGFSNYYKAYKADHMSLSAIGEKINAPVQKVYKFINRYEYLKDKQLIDVF